MTEPSGSLPASAECPVKLHQALVLAPSRLGECQFFVIQRPLPVQHFKVGRGTAPVAHDRQADRLLQIRDTILQTKPYLVLLLITDERIRDVPERPLNSLPVRNQSLLVLGLSEAEIPAQRATSENRLAYLGAVRPEAQLRTHEVGERTASAERTAARPSQRNLREKRRLGDPNFRVRRNQVLFRLANIRPALEDGRRKAGRHFRRQRLLHQRKPARHVLRIIAQQNADGVLLLTNLPFQVRNSGVGSVENLLCLEHIQFCRHSMVEPQPGEFDRGYLSLDRIPCDLQFQIEFEQREVIGGNVTDQSQYDRLACIFRGQQLGA